MNQDSMPTLKTDIRKVKKNMKTAISIRTDSRESWLSLLVIIRRGQVSNYYVLKQELRGHVNFFHVSFY